MNRNPRQLGSPLPDAPSTGMAPTVRGPWPAGLAGARVAAIGSGDSLARILGQLHRHGAMCVAMADPYRAVAELARRSGGFAFVVLALPCIYPEELAAIKTLLRIAPSARVLVGAAEQHVSLLTAALRAGATGVLTDTGIEWLNPDASSSYPPAADLADDSPRTDQDMAHGADSTDDVDPLGNASALVDPVDALTASADSLVDSTQDGDAFDGDPLLSAEELEALLADDELTAPVPPGEHRGGL